MTDEVLIGRLGAQGDGVAAGEELYIPFTLPGERVQVMRHGQRGGSLLR